MNKQNKKPLIEWTVAINTKKKRIGSQRREQQRLPTLRTSGQSGQKRLHKCTRKMLTNWHHISQLWLNVLRHTISLSLYRPSCLCKANVFNEILENQLDWRSCFAMSRAMTARTTFETAGEHSVCPCPEMQSICLSLLWLPTVSISNGWLQACSKDGWATGSYCIQQHQNNTPECSVIVGCSWLFQVWLGLVLLWNCAKQHQAMSTFLSFHNTAWHGLRLCHGSVRSLAKLTRVDRASWACRLDHLHVWNQGYPQLHVKLSWSCWSNLDHVATWQLRKAPITRGIWEKAHPRHVIPDFSDFSGMCWSPVTSHTVHQCKHARHTAGTPKTPSKEPGMQATATGKAGTHKISHFHFTIKSSLLLLWLLT